MNKHFFSATPYRAGQKAEKMTDSKYILPQLGHTLVSKLNHIEKNDNKSAFELYLLSFIYASKYLFYLKT